MEENTPVAFSIESLFFPFLQEKTGMLPRNIGTANIMFRLPYTEPGLDVPEDSTIECWSLSLRLILCKAACKILEAQ